MASTHDHHQDKREAEADPDKPAGINGEMGMIKKQKSKAVFELRNPKCVRERRAV